MWEGCVVLDADFVFEIEDFQNGDRADLFRRIFQVLEKTPVVHPFVADHEFVEDAFVKGLMAQGALRRIDYEDFLPAGDPVLSTLYRKNFLETHNLIRKAREARTGRDDMAPLTPDVDIFRHHSGWSFGEIHSVLMAAELGIPLLYSNDGGSKTAASRYPKGSLTVWNAEEVLAEILKKDPSALTRRERQFLKHYHEQPQSPRT